MVPRLTQRTASNNIFLLSAGKFNQEEINQDPGDDPNAVIHQVKGVERSARDEVLGRFREEAESQACGGSDNQEPPSRPAFPPVLPEQEQPDQHSIEYCMSEVIGPEPFLSDPHFRIRHVRPEGEDQQHAEPREEQY